MPKHEVHSLLNIADSPPLPVGVQLTRALKLYRALVPEAELVQEGQKLYSCGCKIEHGDNAVLLDVVLELISAHRKISNTQ